MKAGRNLFLALALGLIMASPAFCASIVGLVDDSNGNYVNGVTIGVYDATGKEVAKGTTDLYGRYCIGPIKPGKYTLKLDPEKSGLLAGEGVADVGEEGLSVDWAGSTLAPAVATTNLGVASPATATCAAPWWTTAALAAGGVGVAGGATGAVFLPGEEGVGTPIVIRPKTPSK
jgi:hypothetical protein